MSWRHRDTRDDSGAAIVEFIGVTVVLLVPVVYLIVALANIQAGAYAAESAARDAARSAVVTGVAVLDSGGSSSRATAAAYSSAVASLDLVAGDYGFGSQDVGVTMTCSDAECFEPGADVFVDVTIEVPLPGVPGWVANVAPLSVTVSADARAPVDGLAQ